METHWGFCFSLIRLKIKFWKLTRRSVWNLTFEHMLSNLWNIPGTEYSSWVGRWVWLKCMLAEMSRVHTRLLEKFSMQTTIITALYVPNGCQLKAAINLSWEITSTLEEINMIHTNTKYMISMHLLVLAKISILNTILTKYLIFTLALEDNSNSNFIHKRNT